MSSRTLSLSPTEGRMADGARTAKVRAAGRRLACWLAFVLVLGLEGCGGSEPSAPPPLRVEFSGCENVRRGPVCVLYESRRLRFWVEAPRDAAVTVDGLSPADPPVPVAEGLLFEAELAPGARQAKVEARHGGEVRSWSLAVDEARSPDWFLESLKVGAAGDVAAARKVLEPRLSSPNPADRGLALFVAARLDLTTGGAGQAEDKLRRAVAAHRESGFLWREVEDATALAHQLVGRRDFPAARAVLEAIPDPEGHASSAFHRAYAWGLFAVEAGDLRTGVRRLREALDHAARGGSIRNRTLAGQVLARELQRVGRTEEARALFAELAREAEGLPACDRAQLRNNEAWAWLLLREAGAASQDPKPLLQELLRTFDQACPTFVERTEEQVNVRVNLALAHLQDGEPALARRRLAEARALAADPDGNVLLWWADLEARALLAAGDARRALAAWRELSGRARAALAPEAEWRAADGEARALESLGDTAGALAAWRRAEEILERESLLVPMHQGRDTFLGLREAATRRQLDLLLRAGRPGEALAVVRRARSRFLRTLEMDVRLAGLPPAERRVWDRTIAAHREQREALDREAAEHWRLPSGELRQAIAERARRLQDLRGELDALLARFGISDGPGATALPPLPPGEVLLAYHPLPDGWVGFAADMHGVVARRLGRLEEVLEPSADAALAERLLIPFAGQIRRARTLRVLPYGPLRRVAFHALPFEDDLLLAARPVVYALDLPTAQEGSGEGALVVSDPSGNLPGARSEAAEVETALGAGRPSGTVRVLRGRQATGAAVRPLLAASGLFHYAGHAVFAGWDSFLPLAAGGRLTVDDVLALPRSPAWVVLSGCETGASSEESAVESIGLAHAFLAAGSRTVIAAVHPVPDRDAATLMHAFYGELPRQGSAAEALRQAQLTLRARGRSSAWQSFRAFVP